LSRPPWSRGFQVVVIIAHLPDFIVAVWGDRVRKAELMLPVIPAHRFLKVEVLTDHMYKQDSAGGDPITSSAADVLAGLAASITVLAVK
jgi:hypothetical protein